MSPASEIACALNEGCACTALDRDALAGYLAAQPEQDIFASMGTSHPHLFADAPVYASASDLERMEEIAHAIEAIAATPQWAQANPGADGLPARGGRGGLMSYDFHPCPGGPQLIEINTNAGGAFLHALAVKALGACCEIMSLRDVATPADVESRLTAIFADEWRAVRGGGTPGLIAIVDETPTAQYLYPEFLLAARLLSKAGMPAVIAAPEAIERVGSDLRVNGRRIDMIYNRLTDFDLSTPRHAAIRRAWLDDRIVVVPDPRAHALLADKANLVRLSDGAALDALDVDAGTRAMLLAHVPKTVAVTAENADALWSDRAAWYFKPVAGYGAKAVWRGAKMTRKSFADVAAGGYVAQSFVAAPERIVAIDGAIDRRKYDLRLFTHAGATIAVAARLYSGQTTNFRTPGGGFAPVLIV